MQIFPIFSHFSATILFCSTRFISSSLCLLLPSSLSARSPSSARRRRASESSRARRSSWVLEKKNQCREEVRLKFMRENNVVKLIKLQGKVGVRTKKMRPQKRKFEAKPGSRLNSEVVKHRTNNQPIFLVAQNILCLFFSKNIVRTSSLPPPPATPPPSPAPGGTCSEPGIPAKAMQKMRVFFYKKWKFDFPQSYLVA